MTIRPLTRELAFHWPWLLAAWLCAAPLSPASGARYDFDIPGASTGNGMFEEVLTRSHRPDYFRNKYANDLATCCHECTHDINGRFSVQMGAGIEGFYVGGGKFYAFREPHVTITAVAQRIPQQYRDGCYYQLYCVTQPSTQPILNSMPLYLFDEWSASINGAQAAQELGVSDTGDLQMANQFCFFADALLATVRQLDSDYAELGELEEFVALQKKRVVALNNGNRQEFVPRTQFAKEDLTWRVAKQDSAGWDSVTQAKPMQCYNGQCYNGGGYVIQSENRVVTQPVKPKPQPGTVTTSEKLKQDWLAFIKIEVANQVKAQGGECQCDDKDYATKADLVALSAQVDILSSNTAKLSQSVQSIADANVTITNTINNLPDPYQPPTPEELAEKIQPHLDPIRIRQNDHSEPLEIELGGEGKLSPFWIRARDTEEHKRTYLGDEIDLNLQRLLGSSL